MKNATKASKWKILEEHAQSLHESQIAQTNPSTGFETSSCRIQINYSHQHITTNTLELLCELAEACQLRDKIRALMRGDKLNASENQPALHTALRVTSDACILVEQANVVPDIIAARNTMQTIVEQIRSKQWLGFSGKPITHIINIGIGGSDLGPRFALNALMDIASKEMQYHFISDADPYSFERTVSNLDPETTLFIVSSKSFSTRETLYNAQKAMRWIGRVKHYERHFIAVTASADKARQFGIKTILPIWSWIGGRYSFCSAINLITAIAIGFEAFSQILAGANAMDQHFLDADFSNNLPVLLALLGIWNNNFLHIHTLLLLTYAQQLQYFVPYVQQLDMESNGKLFDHQGERVPYATGPLIWGGPGNQAQHSYYQLLCQGTHKIAADFITLNTFEGELINSMCAAKIRMLTNRSNPNTSHPIYLNHIRMDDASPFTIGALVALYEHKIFTQSVIWNINPFNQPGIEQAKALAY